MTGELTITGDVQRLALKPGDVVIVRVDDILSDEQAARLRDYCLRTFSGHEVLVLGRSMSIEVAGAPE